MIVGEKVDLLKLHQEGWERIDDFDFNAIIIAKDNQRMVVNVNTQEIVIIY